MTPPTRPSLSKWIPFGLFTAGILMLAGGVTQQRDMPLVMSLDDAVPRVLEGHVARDLEISEAEQRVAGMSSFVMRTYEPAAPDVAEENGDETAMAALAPFSVYVGYYERQFQGKTIHSPKNCLPGGGWEPLVSSREVLQTPVGPAPVNRYLIGNGPAKALVLYWYQGRGRVAANEYLVKWDLLRDQALLGRSDEALVRVIVPVSTTEGAAYDQARRIAKELVVHVNDALPGRSDGSAPRVSRR